MAFDRWTPQIAAADDEAGRRRLLGEIGVWRARNLTDIPAQREASFAISTLWEALGDRSKAVDEARQLLSLCATTPSATREEQQIARTWMGSLGEKAPRMPTIPDARRDRKDRTRPERPPRPERPARAERAERPAPADRSARHLVSAHTRLTEALALDGDAREHQLVRLERWLRQVAGIPAEPAAPREATPEPVTADDGPLAALIGRRLPGRREPRMRVLERWIAENPSRADELAALSLHDHLDSAGPDAPAPWLVGFVAQGLATGGERTSAALQALRDAGSAATAVYDEEAFQRALSVVRAVPERFAALRRGVLGRQAEPEDRRSWTLRLDGGDRMLVLAPTVAEPYPADLAAQIAERLPHLCARTVVLASGPGNAPLREALAGAGLMSMDGAPSDAELLAALDRVTAVEPAVREPREPREPREARPAREPREGRTDRTEAAAEPTGPSATERFEAVLGSDPRPTVDALREALAGLEKLRDAFLTADRLWDPLPADASARYADLLVAADAAAPDGLRVPEALTLGLKIGTVQEGPAVDALTSGATAERFGGPGIPDLVGIVRAASSAGYGVRRAFRGTTRRERRNNPTLAELSGALDGVWRLGLDGAKRVELWFVAELSVEGRAAVPQLLLEDRERVVVLPIDASLMSWYAGIGGPEAVGWTPEDPSGVREALAALG